MSICVCVCLRETFCRALSSDPASNKVDRSDKLIRMQLREIPALLTYTHREATWAGGGKTLTQVDTLLQSRRCVVFSITAQSSLIRPAGSVMSRALSSLDSPSPFSIKVKKVGKVTGVDICYSI